MVIEFYDLQFEFGFTAIVKHVAGTRMIAQGGDGLLRGATNEGVICGEDFLPFLSLHKSSIDRSPSLQEWIMKWATSSDLIFLQPEDWFIRAHDITSFRYNDFDICKKEWKPTIQKGTYIWSPPPCVADVAIEELRKARIKHHRSTHILAIPKLMSPYWLKSLYRSCDFVIEIPASQLFWNSNMHKPLLLGICLPYFRSHPYIFKNTPKLHSLHWRMLKVFKNNKVDKGNILYELLSLHWKVQSMQGDVVRKLIYFE